MECAGTGDVRWAESTREVLLLPARSARFPRLLAALIAAVAVVLGLSVPSVAFAEPTGNATTAIEMTNGARSNAGVGALMHSDYLQNVAEAWAEELAARGSLEHNPNAGLQLPQGWSDWGENVGTAGAPDGLVAGWLASDDDSWKMLSDGFNVVGMGFATGGDGQLYGVAVFGWYDDPGSVGSSDMGSVPPPAPAEPTQPSQPSEPTETTPEEPEAPEETTPAPAATTPAPAPTTATPTPTPTPTVAPATPGATGTPGPKLHNPDGEGGGRGAAGGGNTNADASAALPTTGTTNVLLIGSTTLIGLLVVLSGSAFFLYYRQVRRAR